MESGLNLLAEMNNEPWKALRYRKVCRQARKRVECLPRLFILADKMNEFQLACLVDLDLYELRKAIDREIKKRRLTLKKAKYYAHGSFSKKPNPEEIQIPNGLIFEKNSSSLMALPNLRRKPGSRSAYLPALMAQDWSHIYPQNDDDNRYCVYAHVDPRVRFRMNIGDTNFTGRPFYIGKGTGNRPHDLKRNQGHGKAIKSVLSAGYKPDQIVNILFNNLTETKAFEIESKLIYFFGTVYQEDRKFGILQNLDIPKTPEFTGEMHKYRKCRIKNIEVGASNGQNQNRKTRIV